MFLADQFSRHNAPIDTTNFPNYNTPYEQLLKSLTEHQHAIFIDLGNLAIFESFSLELNNLFKIIFQDVLFRIINTTRRHLEWVS